MQNNNSKTVKKVLSLLLVSSMTMTLVACGAATSPSAPMTEVSMGMGAAMDSAATNKNMSGLGAFFSSEEEYITNDVIEYAPESPKKPTQTNNNTTDTEDYLSSQKLIYTANISIESLEFEKAQQQIADLVAQHNGFIESNYIYDNAYNWYYDSYEKTRGTLTQELTVRVPSDAYYDFVNGVSSVGKVQSQTENVQNITTQYNDVATTIESLKIQEERLLDMMAACTSIDDMITVERRLSEVQMQLENYQTKMNRYDADIKFSTVTIKLSEVKEYSPTYTEKTFFERLSEHLNETIEDFGAFLEWALFAAIYLLPYGLIITIIIVAIRKRIRKKKATKLVIDHLHDMSPTPCASELQKDTEVQTAMGSKNSNKNSK